MEAKLNGRVWVVGRLFGVVGSQTPQVDWDGLRWETGLIGTTGSPEEALMIRCGAERGYVQVSAELRGGPADMAGVDEWDEVAEASIVVRGNQVWVRSLEDGPDGADGDLPPLAVFGPGDFRVRVYASGRDASRDALGESGERFHVMLWRAPFLGPLSVRATDELGYELRLSELRRGSLTGRVPRRPVWTPTSDERRRLIEQSIRGGDVGTAE